MIFERTDSTTSRAVILKKHPGVKFCEHKINIKFCKKCMEKVPKKKHASL